MLNRSSALASLRSLWLVAAAFAFLDGSCGIALAQEADVPIPAAPKKDGIQIVFLPPPMQGVISLGLYDATGKLVRVLHQEATEKDFTIGQNGLITRWDGKDDRGEPLPAGKYSARGWMTGDLGVDGVAFHGNDWVKDDSPRFAEMLRFQADDAGRWQIVLRDVAGQEHIVPAIPDEAPGERPSLEPVVAEGRLSLRVAGQELKVAFAEGETAIKARVGFGAQVWAIVETAAGREVRSYSAAGEFLRRLAYGADEPVPFDLAAAAGTESVLLLERNAREQRFRVLAQPESTADGALWKTVLQKRIARSDTFAGVARDLGRAEAPRAEAAVTVRAKPNALLQNARAELPLQAVIGPAGVILASTDGLPLLQITEAKNLKWGVLATEGTALTLFQSDGVVIEEFKIAHPDRFMSFDAGEYTLKK